MNAFVIVVSCSLSPGARVGVYEILALIGKGGMGEVYRARDPRLDREVAINFYEPGGQSAQADALHLKSADDYLT